MDRARKQIANKRDIYKIIEDVYGFKNIGEFSYVSGECPNCRESATVVFSAEYERDDDDWEESTWQCEMTTIFCESCGFAADSSEVCEKLNPDFDQKDYQEECFQEDFERNAHGEIESVISLTPVSGYQVARMKISGTFANWESDF
jgi:hypothetical protein